MASKDPEPRRRRTRAGHETQGRAHPERAPHPEPDQDSEPPRTARAPGADAIDEEWGRREDC